MVERVKYAYLRSIEFESKWEILLKYLWSPWRMVYIQSKDQEEKCPLCFEIECEDGPQNLILFRGKSNFVIMNRYPYTSGHLMVVPYLHQSSITRLDPDTRAEMMELSNRCIMVLAKTFHPDGFNLGANIGEAAGAGIVDHVHLHIVPRWSGDTNFMSSVSETRIVPESLRDTYFRIKEVWDFESSMKEE